MRNVILLLITYVNEATWQAVSDAGVYDTGYGFHAYAVRWDNTFINGYLDCGTCFSDEGAPCSPSPTPTPSISISVSLTPTPSVTPSTSTTPLLMDIKVYGSGNEYIDYDVNFGWCADSSGPPAFLSSCSPEGDDYDTDTGFYYNSTEGIAYNNAAGRWEIVGCEQNYSCDAYTVYGYTNACAKTVLPIDSNVTWSGSITVVACT